MFQNPFHLLVKFLFLNKTNIFFWLNCTYSPIYLKCDILTPNHMPTHLSICLSICPCNTLPTSLLGKYILNPTYMVKPTYLINIPIDLVIAKINEEKNEVIAWNLDLFI